MLLYASYVFTMTCLFLHSMPFCFFFFNDTATTEIYTLSLHDALPISPEGLRRAEGRWLDDVCVVDLLRLLSGAGPEHDGAARARSAGRARCAPQVGLGLAGQPPRDVQPRVRRPEGQPLERA